MSTSFALSQVSWARGNSELGALGLYVLLGLIVVGLVVAFLRNGVGGIRSPLAGPAAPSFNRRHFRRAARAAGLSDEETRSLEPYGKALGVVNPEFLFRNQQRLDAFFLRAYRIIERDSDSESDADARKTLLFAARERLSHAQTQGTPVTTSRQLGRNTPLTFLAPGEESYPSVIIAIEPGGMAVEPARDAYGEPVRFRKGTRLTCFFYAQGRQGYQFPTKVAGWERLGNKEVMVISHSEAVTALPARRNARKESKVPCTFYRVAVTAKKVKGKEQTSAKVESLPYPGTITDISAGGVAIQSANALQAGEFVKLEFNPGGGSQAAFAKVVRMNSHRGVGGVMHLRFVKISRRSLNAILSYVYGYAE